jgi:hypothetical protein
MRKSLWTKDEERRADKLRALKVSYFAIDGILNKGRGTTRSFYRRKAESPEARAKRLDYLNKRRTDCTRPLPSGGGRDVRYVPPIERDVPADVLAERARAWSQPLSLCASLMGDPPLVRSALGKNENHRPHISLAPIRGLSNIEALR